MGRPSVLGESETKRAAVIEVLRSGGSLSKAGRAAGCSRQSILRYMQAFPDFAFECGYDADSAQRPPMDKVARPPTAEETKAIGRRLDTMETVDPGVADLPAPDPTPDEKPCADLDLERELPDPTESPSEDPPQPEAQEPEPGPDESLSDVIDPEVVESEPRSSLLGPIQDLGEPTPDQVHAAAVLEAPVDVIQELDASMPSMDDVVLPDGTKSLKLSANNVLMLAWLNAQDRTAHPSVRTKGMSIIARVTLQTAVERMHLRERARAAQIEEMRREALRSESIETESTQDNSGMVILEVPRNEARPHLHPEG